MISDHELDGLLQKAVPIVRCRELEAVEKLMAKNPPHVFSKEYEERKEEIVKGHPCHRKAEDGQGKVKRGRVKMRYLLVAVLLLILSSTVVLGNETIREILSEIVYTVFPTNVVIEPVEEETDVDNVNATIGFEAKRPQEVPEEYVLLSEDLDMPGEMLSMVWQTSSEESVCYYYYNSDSSVISVTADGQVPEEIAIGDKMAKVTVDDRGVATGFYEDGEYTVVLTGKLEKDELVRMLKSVK